MLRFRPLSKVPSPPRAAATTIIASPFLSTQIRSPSFSSSNHSHDINWYVKLWEDRINNVSTVERSTLPPSLALSSSAVASASHIATKSILDENKHRIGILLRQYLDVCRTELVHSGSLSNSSALPADLCFRVYDVYRDAMKQGKVTDEAGREARLRFIVHFTTFSSIDIPDLEKRISKLGSLAKEFAEVSSENNNNTTNNSNKNEEIESASSSAFDDEKNQTVAESHLQILRDHTQIATLARSIHLQTEPIHQAWMKRMISLPGGTTRMLTLRGDLIELLSALKQNQKSNNNQTHHSLDDTCGKRDIRAVDAALADLTRILRNWFSPSWLSVQELTWLNCSAATIEQVKYHERVHPFTSLEDVKHRMAPTKMRSMFAFFHPHVPHEPIVMLQIALTRGVASSVDRILGRPIEKVSSVASSNKFHQTIPGQQDSTPNCTNPDTAIFYSISSTQRGLTGIEMGKLLIKQAMSRAIGVANDQGSNASSSVNEQQQQDSTTATSFSKSAGTLSTFSTLSPIPGFTRWAFTNSNRVLKTQMVNYNDNKNNSNNNNNMSRAEIFTSCFFASIDVSSSSSSTTSTEFKYNKPNIAAAEKVLELLDEVAGVGVNVVEKENERKLLSVTEAVDLFWSIMNHDDDGNKNKKKMSETTLKWFQKENNTKEEEFEKWATIWVHNDKFASACIDFLLPSVKHYLIDIKRRGKCMDPVANFHLRNGACILRINPLADLTPKGSISSACFMVNYEYDIEKYDYRAVDYENTGEFDVCF